MIREFFKRAVVGFACSTLVGQTVSFFVALKLGGTAAFPAPVTPRFAALVGNPAAAAFLQLLLTGLLGFSFAGCTVLFQVEGWSFLRQSLIYLFATGAIWTAVEALCWLSDLRSAACFAACSLLTYGIVWGVQYFVWRGKVRRLNARIRERNGEDA